MGFCKHCTVICRTGSTSSLGYSSLCDHVDMVLLSLTSNVGILACCIDHRNGCCSLLSPVFNQFVQCNRWCSRWSAVHAHHGLCSVQLVSACSLPFLTALQTRLQHIHSYSGGRFGRWGNVSSLSHMHGRVGNSPRLALTVRQMPALQKSTCEQGACSTSWLGRRIILTRTR